MATEISSGQILELLKRNQSKNGQEPLISGDDLQALLDDPKIWRSIAKNVEQEQKPEKPTFPPPTVATYKVKVHHGETHDKRVKAGKYDWVNDWIGQKNTPVVVDKAKGTEDKEVFLLHFNRYMTSEQIVEAMAVEGYKPAEHEDLLAFGADHPGVQREFPIVQLGSVWVHPDDGRVVSFLDGYGSERYLRLSDWDGEWHGGYRFLAVRA